jgi:O-antigen/teichoic acid export membrane protein
VALTSWGLALVVLVLAEPLLGIFGEAFRAGAPALRLLTLGYMGASLMSLASALLNMTGHHSASTATMLAGTALTAALCLMLVPRWGIVGAAAATAVSTLVWNLGLLLMARRRLGVTAAPLAPAAGG